LPGFQTFRRTLCHVLNKGCLALSTLILEAKFIEIKFTNADSSVVEYDDPFQRTFQRSLLSPFAEYSNSNGGDASFSEMTLNIY
jgi:hypothetical protein